MARVGPVAPLDIVTPLVDTHAHFGLEQGLEAALRQVTQASAAGLGQIIAVGGSETLNHGALALRHARPESVCVAVGVDRAQAESITPEQACRILQTLWGRLRAEGAAPVALGEIGLDFHYDRHTAQAQIALFEAQVRLAATHNLPVIVHSREADDETLHVLSTCGCPLRRAEGHLGVLHCFTGSLPFAEQLLALGLYISFSGIVTFRNADALREVARHVPLERLLIETDCPYLTPVPLRGRPNEPAFVTHVAACLADVRGVPVAEIRAATTRNAQRLFGLQPAAS